MTRRSAFGDRQAASRRRRISFDDLVAAHRPVGAFLSSIAPIEGLVRGLWKNIARMLPRTRKEMFRMVKELENLEEQVKRTQLAVKGYLRAVELDRAAVTARDDETDPVPKP